MKKRIKIKRHKIKYVFLTLHTYTPTQTQKIRILFPRTECLNSIYHRIRSLTTSPDALQFFSFHNQAK